MRNVYVSFIILFGRNMKHVTFNCHSLFNLHVKSIESKKMGTNVGPSHHIEDSESIDLTTLDQNHYCELHPQTANSMYIESIFVARMFMYDCG